MEIDYTIPVPVLGKLAEHLVHSRNQRELDLSMQNIKDAVEGYATAVNAIPTD